MAGGNNTNNNTSHSEVHETHGGSDYNETHETAPMY